MGKQPEQGGVWREIYVYRARRMVHVYRIESHGRRFYRSLEYATDARFALRAMQPETVHRQRPWPSWGRHEAGHPYASSYKKQASAVISRDWTVEENLSLGKETYVPSRLLFGILPEVLLKEFEFWQDEADQLRGYPKQATGQATSGQSTGQATAADDVLLVRIGRGAHVAFYGARFDKVKLSDHALTPACAIVLRLKRARLAAQVADVEEALEVAERFLRASGVLEGAFEPSFQTCTALLGLVGAVRQAPVDDTLSATLQAEGKAAAKAAAAKVAAAKAAAAKARAATAAASPSVHGPTAATSSAPPKSDSIGALLEALLHRLDLTPFQRRRRQHRTAAAVVPALIDAAHECLAACVSRAQSAAVTVPSLAEPEAEAADAPPTASEVATPATKPGGAASASDIESEELVLLDLLHAPEDSYLASLATLLTRIENLSHVLAWARFNEQADLRSATALSHEDLHVVSLPRLKLTFQARRVGDRVRLFSVDHADLFVTNERSAETTELLVGIPHSLLLSNSNGELSVLVPSVMPVRPKISIVAFSTELVLDRSDKKWEQALENPYYVYPVHVSLCFLSSTTLASALYLLLLRSLARQYHAVVQLVDTIASDTDLTAEEANSLAFLNSSRNSPDAHPNAHATRLKISLVMLDSPVSPPWDLSQEMSAYVRKSRHVSSNCRLTAEEELTLLGLCVCDPSDRRFNRDKHTCYSVLLCKNRRSALRAALAAPEDAAADRALATPPDAALVGASEGAAAAASKAAVTCAVEVPPGPPPNVWIRQWSGELADGVTDAQVDALLQGLAMKYTHYRSLQLDTMLGLLSTYNRHGNSPSGGNTIASGAFLLLYNLFQGLITCRVYASNCSQSFATLLLAFFQAELGEPSLINALLLTLARKPELGPFLPAFNDTRKHKRRDLLTGLPLPDEEHAPLGILLKSAIREVAELGGASTRRHDEVTRTMLARRVDVLTKERMWYGWGGGYGGGGGGYGGTFSGAVYGVNGGGATVVSHSVGGWGGGWGSGSGYGGYGSATSTWGGGGQTSYQRLEALAAETEQQCAKEIKQAATWRQLTSLLRADEAAKQQPPAWRATKGTCVLPPSAAAAKLAPATASDHACARRRVRDVADCASWQLRALCSAPLEVASSRWCTKLTRAEMGQPPVGSALGFDVSPHPDAESKVARDMQARLAADANEFAEQVNPSSVCRLTFLLDPERVVAGTDEARTLRAAAEASLRALMGELEAQRASDSAYVRRVLPDLLSRANAVPVGIADAVERLWTRAPLSAADAAARQEDGTLCCPICLLEMDDGEPLVKLPCAGDHYAHWDCIKPWLATASTCPTCRQELAPAERERREIFALRKMAAQEAVVSPDFLLCLLVSSRAVDDLRATNPFVSVEAAEAIFDELTAAVLHASRVGQINRCLSEATGLLQLLCPAESRGFGACEGAQREAASALALNAESLAEQMLTRRHYVDPDGEGQPSFDPRFLLFEFTHNIVLRKAQVELVHDFVHAVETGQPLVKQMLMGGGKTTVVGPLLSMILADGARLVVQTMPPALLEQSKATLRATFSSIVRKRVFTLSFDRSSEMRWPTVDKLKTAARNRGVVLCTAATIKSLQLKLLEKMDVLRDVRRKQHPDMERDVRALAQVLKLFRTGCLIMDEVDLLLHPLKSELNFPVGAKHPLDFSPERWTCAIHCLDAVFYVERQSMSVPFHQSGRAHRILEQLSAVIERGYEQRALQRSPHLVLLNVEWYHEHVLPVMALWMMLWLESNHVAGLTAAQIELFITGRSSLDADVETELHAAMEARLDAKSFKLLNATKEWLRTYLPFCLQKIDRVSFGLLSMHEYQRLLQSEPHMPRSRLKLAIPFVGKDVPSRASEFAHPDIIIGLTVLAYRYEGLRKQDFETDIIALLRADFEKEVGPFPLRKSSQLYASWIEQAGGSIKGLQKKPPTPGQPSPTSASAAAAATGPAPLESALAPTEEEESKTVVPLWLLKQSNDEQMGRLYHLLRKLPSCVHYLLEQVVFPSFMQHQLHKLSASGQELGGSMIFDRRIGFSGTPSDLLPLDLGRCGYERGSEGKMMHVLSDPKVMSTQGIESGWKVKTLLQLVATARPRFKALIDTGALITGYSNRQVAERLLKYGLHTWCEGVVFLSEEDEKMILVKATGRVLKLSQCGIAVENRFAFYDQIHTTGMDIKHALNARAALTLGKDMVFRDLAQGAYRMRGIGQGQCVTVFVIPEVQELMQRQLSKAGYEGGRVHVPPEAAPSDATRAALQEVTAWLVINSMKTERLQFDQLCTQNLANLWRQNAFEQLIDGHRSFTVRPAAAAGYVLDMLGEAFVSNREGAVSRAKIEGRILALYFRQENLKSSHQPHESALREIHAKYLGGKGHAFEVVQICQSQGVEAFASSFREMPWLAIPFAHAQRRTALRKLFEVKDGEDMVRSPQTRRSLASPLPPRLLATVRRRLTSECVSIPIVPVAALADRAAQPGGADDHARGHRRPHDRALVRAGPRQEGQDAQGAQGRAEDEGR